MRKFILIAGFVIAGQAIAHVCCYSETVTYSHSPACPTCQCTYMTHEITNWKEYWPESGDPSHSHYWETGSYTDTTGPYRYPNCEGD